eukprot:g72258.t1
MTQTQLSVCLVDEYANQAVSADVAARVEQQVDADASARKIQLIPSRRCHLNAGAISSEGKEAIREVLSDLKTIITPTAQELKKAVEGKGAGDPDVPLEEQKAAVDALGANFTYEDLEACLPEKEMAQAAETPKHQRKNGTSSSQQAVSVFLASDNKACFNCRKDNHVVKNCSEECVNKPTHTGAECKVRGSSRRNNSNQKGKAKPKGRGVQTRSTYNNNSNNKPKDPRKARVVNKPAAYLAKTAEGRQDDIDDAWAGLAVEQMIEQRPELGQIEVEMMKLPPELVKVTTLLPNRKLICGIATEEISEPAEKTDMEEPQRKKQKPEEEPRQLKKCAHIQSNDESAPAETQKESAEIADERMDCEHEWLEFVPIPIVRHADECPEPTLYNNVAEKYTKQVVDKDVSKRVQKNDGTTAFVKGRIVALAVDDNEARADTHSTSAITTTGATTAAIESKEILLDVSTARMTRYEIVRDDPAGARYQLPSRVTSRPAIMTAAPATRPSTYQEARCQVSRKLQGWKRHHFATTEEQG